METNSQAALPQKTREIQNFLMDSTRWNDFAFRDDDIVIATWSKSGTTWMQQIVGQLVFEGSDNVFGAGVSPWIEFQTTPEAPARAAAQTHRRFMKTHLPLDALVFSPKAKYIYVGRDARDVVWSLHHHLSSFTPLARERYTEFARRTGTPPPPPGVPDVRAFYHLWLENDAASPNSYWKNVQGWWNARSLPNVMLVHYANLKVDLPGEMRRIARFLDIAIDESKFAQMLAHCGLEHMKERASHEKLLEETFEGGGRNFVNKGINGRWHDILSPEEVAKCDVAAAANLTPDCAHWLKTGEMLASS